MRPDAAFSAAGALAILSWLALSASLFLPDPARLMIWTATTIGVSALIGIAYGVLLVQGMRERTGGGFESIASVRRLFSSDAALAAGWLHYIAFDLFVGTWIARAGLAASLSPILIVPCLLLTFLVGPVGLLVFVILRLALTGQIGLTP